MARYVPQTHFFGAGALAILVNSLNGAGTGSLGELDSHAKSGSKVDCSNAPAITLNEESLRTKLQINAWATPSFSFRCFLSLVYVYNIICNG